VERIPTNWLPVMGEAPSETDGALVFNGGTSQSESGEVQPKFSLFISDVFFTGGSICMDVENPHKFSACDIVFFYNPFNFFTFHAGLSNETLFSLRSFDNKWNYLLTSGPSIGIQQNKKYSIKVDVHGSRISMSVNGIVVLNFNLPLQLVKTQVGVFCKDSGKIRITNYKVTTKRPSAFVVMQFSSPYNDVYADVIQRICEELHVDVLRIDEKSGPGLIVADISRAITESHLVIADISPVNANVYYELGLAHALNKPTILLAENGTKLPFDLSPFRTLFYENSIAGKKKLEDGLRAAINSIINENS
jgi:hypothetical protein